jgi:hypothetical protein
MRRIEICTGATMALFLGGCVAKETSSPKVLAEPLGLTPTQTLTLDEVIGVTPSFTESKYPVTPTSFLTPTPEKPALVNPWKGHVFNQRCTYTENKETGITEPDCVEDWAEKPLPGGCIMAKASCNAAATSYVLNEFVSPEIFMEKIGQPGITPDVLIEKVYTNLPIGPIVMTCDGAGSPTVDRALEYFGLEVRDVILSEYTVAAVVKNLKPNERLMISMIGINAKGKKFQHWSVANGVGTFKGHETVYYHDSFFYKDLKNYDPHMVYFEESPNIKNDPTRYTGKAFDYVGAMIVTLPEEVGQVSYEEELIKNDSRFVETLTGIENLEYLGGPEKVGEDRYKITVRYQDRVSNFYYFDPYFEGKYPPTFEKQANFRWGDYLIPLYFQLDPRWAGKKLDKVNPKSGIIETFGGRSCGLTVGASVFSIRKQEDATPLIDPYSFYKKYYPDFTGYATLPWTLMETFKEGNFNVEEISNPTEETIAKAVDENKLVVINTMVNFGWYDLEGGKVNHFVLVLGKTKEGELLIYDPYWGTFVTKAHDLDLLFSEITVFTVGYPQ